MLKRNIYNLELSQAFIDATTSSSQYIKPKIVIDFLDSRHAFNKQITTNSPHSSEKPGDLGYYFAPIQLFNGNDRQSYTWAVADALDNNGKVIKADGTWHAMPSSREENFEFGWWSASKSSSSSHPTYNGYSFQTPVTVNTTFNPRPCNQITISTPEYSGQIDTYQIIVRSSDAGVPNPLYQEIARIKDGESSYTHFLPESVGHQTINEVDIEILTTKNPEDYARLNSINILFREDVSDYVVTYNQSKTRDLHETSLPIAGSDSGAIALDLDNSEKNFNLFNTQSKYGRFMRKDLKVYASSGWKVSDVADQYVQSQIRSTFSDSSTTLRLDDNTLFPDGGVGNYFVLEIDPFSKYREFVLCSGKSNNYDINIVERGFNNSIARNHAIGVPVRYETFEYPYFTEYYIDEWQSSSQSMVTSFNASDWSKFLSERVLTGGFFMEKVTVPEACENLMLFSNFPKADIDSLNRFDISARKNGAILHLDFNELSVDRSGNDVIVSEGLRARFFAIPPDALNKVQDITADALDRELSQLEKALGETVFTSPTFVVNSKDISDFNEALNLADPDETNNGFSFFDIDGKEYSEYFNAVYDGIYIPSESGGQYLVARITNGGVRIFLEDTLILDSWRINAAEDGNYFTIESEEIDLIAGTPYKLRIETFHKTGEYRFRLDKAIGVFSPEPVLPEETRTIAAVDRIGVRNAGFQPLDLDRNKQQNSGIFIGNALIGLSGGLRSSTDNRYCDLASGSYIRLPYHASYDVITPGAPNYINGDFTVEIYCSFPEHYSGDGEFISNYSNSSPTTGFEFFQTDTENGFKVITSNGEVEVVSSDVFDLNVFYHIVLAFKDNILKYYVNGELKAEEPVAGTITSWANKGITIGGRGARFIEFLGEEGPETARRLLIDEFLIYPYAFSDQLVSKRYTEAEMKELTIYPFLYGGEVTITDVINEISLADLGRFYINEENIAKYEHYYKFWEETIDQHANVQLIIDDDSHIVASDYVVQLQANKVVVKVSGISSNLSGVQPLWRADSPTTLAVVTLSSPINDVDESMFVSTTDDPPFAKAGYLIIDDEIIKYNNKSPNQFLTLERGQFGTDPASHSTGARVREVRYWDLKFDKAPAYQVRNPFITGIKFEQPNEISILKYNPSAYGAEFIIAASNNVSPGSIVFAEGVNPLTEKVAFTSIAGIPILVSEQNSQIQEQTAAIEACICIYGVKEVVIENKFITDFVHAKKIADFIIEKNLLPVPVLNLQTYPTPQIQVGDRIKVSELDAFDIINGEYWVIAKDFTYSETPNQNMTLRKVS